MVGEEIKVMLMAKSDSDVYPAWQGHWIPLRVKAEYRDFYLCEVLPHVNPLNKGYKTMSRTYNITIQKWDIGRKWKIRKGNI